MKQKEKLRRKLIKQNQQKNKQPELFVALVRCKCGWAIRIREEDITGERLCQKCNAKVRIDKQGSRLDGFCMPFMTYEWLKVEAWLDADENNIKGSGKPHKYSSN